MPAGAQEDGAYQAWRALAEAGLKGADFERRLVGRTLDGLAIEPLYTRTRAAAEIAAAGPVGAAPFVRGAACAEGRPWVVAQRIEVTDPAEANREALADLENGVEGLVLGLANASLGSAAAIDRLLAGVLPDLIQITIEAGPASAAIARSIADWAERGGHELATLRLLPGFDAVAGGADLDEAARTGIKLRERGLRGPLAIADARVWHEAGASEAQEIGFAVVAGLETARALERAGLDAEAAFDALAFKAALDADQFLSIAKLRALKLVWSRAAETAGLAPRPVEIRAESSRRMMTARDPHVNMLRTTAACFAGAVGGADEIALHPFTAALGAPDGFARRMARNAQAILREESGFGAVADPAGGSAYVESLTQRLGEAAWDVVRAAERAGGLRAALAAGSPQAAVAAMREKRERAVAERRTVIVGVSDFAALDDRPAPPQPKANATSGPLPPLRLAAPFESLRDRADQAALEAGERPAVYLAELAGGEVRAAWAAGLFAAGGLAARRGGPFASADDLAAAFAASGCRAVCLCGSDAAYAERGAAAANALKAAAPPILMMAGNPGDRRDVYLAAGVELFVHAGADALEALTIVQERLGIT